MLTKMYTCHDFFLPPGAVEKPVENVENSRFSTPIPEIPGRFSTNGAVNKALHTERFALS